MSISLELCDFNDIYRRLTEKPIIINDLADISEKEKQRINDLISVTYDSDLLRSVSSCKCGEVRGEHRVGEVCNECGHTCRPPIEDNLEPIVWVRSPRGVHALMNPTVWIMLSKKFTKSGHNLLLWICDSTYKSNRKPIKEIAILEQMGFKRSYNWFVENFDLVVKTLFELLAPPKSKQDLGVTQADNLQELLTQYRHCIFSNYLPLPNRTLLIIEKTKVGTYVDRTVVGAIDAINTIAAIDHDLSYHSDQTRQNRTAKMLAGFADYFDEFYKDFIGEKTGLARKNIYGSRSNFSMRAVATSITKPHQHDELHVSWGAAVGVLRYHCINKYLHKYNYTANECFRIMSKYSRRYSPVMDNIFKELISESKYGGIPVTHGRNPSLARGSIQLLRITQVKTNLEDPTISFSILITPPMNADFDGDALNSTLPLDNHMAELLSDMAPYKSGLNLESVREISGDMIISKPVVATTSNYMLKAPEPVTTHEQENFMRMMSV